MTHAESRITDVSEISGVAVVRFCEPNDAVPRLEPEVHRDRLTRDLAAVVARMPVAVIVDFEYQDVTRGSAVENLLVQLSLRLEVDLKLCHVPQQLVQRFEANQLALMFQIHAGLDEALRSVDRTPFLVLPQGQRIPLSGDSLLIGRIPYDDQRHRNVLDIRMESARHEGDQLYLPDPEISRHHARVTRVNESTFAIEDLQSRNGTFVDDHSIRKKIVLKRGAVVRFGKYRVGYCHDPNRRVDFPWTNRESD